MSARIREATLEDLPHLIRHRRGMFENMGHTDLAALDAVDRGAAQISFLLNPCDVEQVVKIATSNEVMPQKSTDFYPKLLSGITMYRIEG